MDVNTSISTLGAIVRGLRRDPSGTTVYADNPAALLDSIDGYVVGGFAPSLRVAASEEGYNILNTPEGWGSLAVWLRDLPTNTRYVGAWRDGNDYVFDSVNIYQNRKLALDIAAASNEYSIYDGFAQKEIVVADYR
jgi:hypothetical protein